MDNFLISFASIIVVLGVMVLVHEWGHFIVARMCGVRVDVFSVGMGPRIWGFRRGATDYRVSALPIGGYVRMAGENPTDERTGAPDEFLSKKRWQRALIILAGPTMNILLALIIATGMMMSGKGQPAFLKNRPQIAAVSKDSAAAQAGLRRGDVLLKVNGKRVRTWDDAIWQSMFVMPKATIPVVVERDSRRVALSIKTSPDDSQTDLFGYPQQKTFVGPVKAGLPAAEGGLKQGDQVISIDGNRTMSPFSISSAVAGSDGQPVPMTVQRDGETIHLTLHPIYGELGGGKRWYIGAYFDSPVTYRATTLGSAIRDGVRYNVMLTSAIINTVVKLVEHKAQLKQLSGPVGIAKASGQAAREGLLAFMNIMAVISLNLGILNLLPIPILDGWHILTLGVEGTIRRDLSIAVKERAMQVGLVFLLLLILIVTYNDVLKIVVPGH
ncbi:MAG TPA: RIP metalloprotease RseP [Candidatus Dormibacteraeota bacterium]|nr:RIP metalloprotease RseP [Candidatus Dormibacteraeota bacterium]